MSKKAQVIFACLLVVVAVLLVVANRERRGDELRIGHVAPLTGDAALWGNWEREGIDLAVEHVNAAGGLAGLPVRVIHEDDRGTPADAVSAFTKLTTADRVRIVIGGTLSSTTLAMAPLAERQQVVLLSPSAQSPKISEAGRFIFRIFASSTVEGAYLAHVVESQGCQTASLLYLNNDYGLGLRTVIDRELSGRVPILAREAYSDGTREFRTHIRNAVIGARPECLLLLGFPTDMAGILRQLQELDLRPRIFAPNSFEAEEILRIAGAAPEGVTYIYPTLPNIQRTQEVQEAFRERYGKEMNVYNGMGYDALMVLAHGAAEAFKVSGLMVGESLRQALHAIEEYPGVTGSITFDVNGDVVSRPMEPRIVRDGKFSPLRITN